MSILGPHGPARRSGIWRILGSLGGLLLLGAGPDATRNAMPPPSPSHATPANALLIEDFSNGRLEGWTSDQPGVWSVRSGVLRGDLPDGRQLRSILSTGASSWVDYAVDLDVCGMRGVDKGVVLHAAGGRRGVGVDLRGLSYQDVVMYGGDWPMGRAPVTNANSVWHHIRAEARGDLYRVWVNGVLLIEKRDGRHRAPQGGIALPAYTGGYGSCTVYYDNVVVTPLKPLP